MSASARCVRRNRVGTCGRSAGTTSPSSSSTKRSPGSRSPASPNGPESDREIVNVNGGAIAVGHPLGATGGRILGDLAASCAVWWWLRAWPRSASVSDKVWQSYSRLKREGMAIQPAPTVSGLILPRYRRDPEGTRPPLGSPGYGTTRLRHPKQPLVILPQKLTEVTGPVIGRPTGSARGTHDLTGPARRRAGGAAHHRAGRVLDADGRPVPTRWSRSGRPTRAAVTATRSTTGRPRSTRTSPVPAARSPTSAGRYEFTTIKPGAYPWRQPRQRLAARRTSTSRCSAGRSPSGW